MKIHANNFKGRTFVEELLPVTIYTGPNKAGKSTRLEALMLALAGYVPGIPEKQSAIYSELASGNPLRVVFERGQLNVGHRFESVRGSVKAEHLCTEGEFENFPRVAIDYNEFFGLSGPERVKFLFSRAQLPPAMTVEAFTQTITANVKNIRLEENTPATEKVIAATVAHILQRPTRSPQEWLEQLIVDSKVSLNAANATAKRMESTMQGLTAVSTESQAAPDCEARCEVARKEMEAAKAEVTRLETLLDNCRAEYRTANALATQAVDETKTRQQMAILEREKERTFKLSQVAPDLFGAKQKHSEARAAWSATIDKGLKPFDLKKKELGEQIEAAKKGGVCSHCGQDMKPDKALAAKLKKELTALLATEPALKQAQRDACEAMNAAEKEAQATEEQHAQYTLAAKEFRTASQEHADLQSRLAQSSEAQTAVKKLPELRERGETLNKQLGDAHAKAACVNAQFETINAEVRKLTAERAVRQQRALVIEDCAKARAESAVLKELCAMLAKLQAQLVNTVVGPLIESANEICAPILGSLEYRDGEIMFAGTAYSHRTMSGTEKTIFYAAVSYALGQNAPLKILLLDEFDIDEKNYAKLVIQLCYLHAAGKLDLAVLAHTTAPVGVSSEYLKINSL